MKQAALVLAIALWVAGCGERHAAQDSKSQPVPATGNGAAAAPHEPQPARSPDTITDRSDTKAELDPKSTGAARAVVDSYCDLLKRGQYANAHHLWSGDTSSDRQFTRQWTGYGQLEGCVVDDAGPLEGAAGSAYTSVPLELFFSGGRVRLSGALTLRRVNDVPGSTEEQRHWHIVRSELQPVD